MTNYMKKLAILATPLALVLLAPFVAFAGGTATRHCGVSTAAVIGILTMGAWTYCFWASYNEQLLVLIQFTMYQETKGEKYIHRIFVVGILIKALDGVLEILGGIALLFTGVLTSLATVLIQHELIEDPHDFLATQLQHVLPVVAANSGWFATAYLLSHGVIKIFLVIGLLRDKLWAYPTAIIVFALFVVYQIYRYTFAPSIFLILLTLLDIVVIGLTWHEYHYFKKHHTFAR